MVPLVVLLLLMAGSSQAAIHTVPGDFPTVQAALDTAQPGDVVV